MRSSIESFIVPSSSPYEGTGLQSAFLFSSRIEFRHVGAKHLDMFVIPNPSDLVGMLRPYR